MRKEREVRGREANLEETRERVEEEERRRRGEEK
jgi:hypothetical protein